jgi:hypothetical protein
LTFLAMFDYLSFKTKFIIYFIMVYFITKENYNFIYLNKYFKWNKNINRILQTSNDLVALTKKSGGSTRHDGWILFIHSKQAKGEATAHRTSGSFHAATLHRPKLPWTRVHRSAACVLT